MQRYTKLCFCSYYLGGAWKASSFFSKFSGSPRHTISHYFTCYHDYFYNLLHIHTMSAIQIKFILHASSSCTQVHLARKFTLHASLPCVITIQSCLLITDTFFNSIIAQILYKGVVLIHGLCTSNKLDRIFLY